MVVPSEVLYEFGDVTNPRRWLAVTTDLDFVRQFLPAVLNRVRG